MRSEPLVTCIMPTRNRAWCAERALACFESQTWAGRELLILDDGDAPSFPLQRDWPTNIRYFRLTRRQTVGAKRNLAIAHARGSIIAHWDDDDWSAPGRLEQQVKALADTQITGYRSMAFVDFTQGESWIYRGKLGYALGTSLCYRIEFWREHPFPDLMIGEDNAVVKSVRGLVSEDAGQMMYATIHGSNTSNKRAAMNPQQWERITWPEWIERVAA